VDVLYLIYLLVYDITGDTTGLKLIHLLINQIEESFLKILDEVFDHLGNHQLGLLFILTFISKVLLGSPVCIS
jgi:hypothetical protein